MPAGGLVVSILPSDEMPSSDWPAQVMIPCGMGDARNLLMTLAGDACIVIGGGAGTISEVCLAWLHKRPLLPLTGCGGWSDTLASNPPEERQSSVILPWESVEASDTWIDNELSQICHEALGFEVVDRCVHYCKTLQL